MYIINNMVTRRTFFFIGSIYSFLFTVQLSLIIGSVKYMKLYLFFENILGKFWFWFIHNNMSLFHHTILNVKCVKTCTTEAALEYFKLINTLNTQRKRNIFTNQSKRIIIQTTKKLFRPISISS